MSNSLIYQQAQLYQPYFYLIMDELFSICSECQQQKCLDTWIETIRSTIFFKWFSDAGSQVSGLFFFQKSFIWSKYKWSSAYFEYIVIVLNLTCSKNKLHKALVYWSGDMLNFDFSEKGLGLVLQPHVLYDYSTKLFHIIYSINWPNIIAWLILVLEILVNMCIPIVC